MPIKKSEIKKIQESEEVAVPEVEVTDEIEVEDIEEVTAAAATLVPNSMPVGPANKADTLSKIVNALAAMDVNTINKFHDSMSWPKSAADGVPSGNAAKNKKTVDTKPSGAVGEEISLEDDVKKVVSEEISNLFEGEDLKEDFKEKLSVVIESVVNLNTSKRVAEIEEEYENALAEEVEAIRTKLVEDMETALDYAIDSWMDANEVAIVSSIKSDLTEQFVDGLKELFATHYITVPDDKIDVLEELQSHVEELEALVNQSIAEKFDLEKEIAARDEKLEEAAVAKKLAELSEGLAETDKERFLSLTENVEYIDLADFTHKAEILKESLNSGDTKDVDTKVLFEEIDIIEDTEAAPKAPKLTGSMASYVDALDRIR